MFVSANVNSVPEAVRGGSFSSLKFAIPSELVIALYTVFVTESRLKLISPEQT